MKENIEFEIPKGYKRFAACRSCGLQGTKVELTTKVK